MIHQASGLPYRFAKKVNFTESCWLWTAYKNHNGYGTHRINGKAVRAHRFVWEYFNVKIPDGLYVLHKCDTPACVNPDHLFLGTHQDNMNDMRAKGRGTGYKYTRKIKSTRLYKTGEEHFQAKLDWGKVLEIRGLYQKGSKGEFNTEGLSKKYGMSKTQIKRIVNNQHWREVDIKNHG